MEKVLTPFGVLATRPLSRKIMGEREDEQAYKLNKTMDEFLETVNACLSQLAIEMKKVDDTTGAQVTQMRVALTKKQNL
eukprot:1751345-Amphidinium_carterae.2